MGLYCQPLLGARGSTLTDVTVCNDVVVKSRMKFVWSILQFCSTKPTDSGQYTCIADNEFIHNRTTFQLTHSWFVVPRITKGCATIHSLRCYDMYAMSPQSPQTSWSCVVDQKHTGISREHNPPDLHRWHHVDASRPNCLLGVYDRWCSYSHCQLVQGWLPAGGCIEQEVSNSRGNGPRVSGPHSPAPEEHPHPCWTWWRQQELYQYSCMASNEIDTAILNQTYKLTISRGKVLQNTKLQASKLWLTRLYSTVSLDYCTKFPCRKGGTCFSHQSLYSCDCPLSWNGVNCEKHRF